MENVYLNLEDLRLDTITFQQGIDMQVHIIDKIAEKYRYIQVMSDTIEQYIRANELVCLRKNINGVPYLKRMQEMDEGNYIKRGFLVSYDVMQGYFTVIGNRHKCRLVSSFSSTIREKSLMAIPNNTLVAVIPDVIEGPHKPVFYYYSFSIAENYRYYDSIDELKKAIVLHEVIMHKNNHYVLQFVLKKNNNC